MNMHPHDPAGGGALLLYLGTADGLHILRGDQTRREWIPAVCALAGHDISALAWDERAPEVVFAGTAAGLLLRSGDGGATWEPAGVGLPGGKVWSIVPDPHASAGALYAGVDGGYLLRSDDGGASWRELAGLRALPDSGDWWGPFGPAIFHSILPDAGRPGSLYAGLSVAGVLASDDGGATWRDDQHRRRRQRDNMAERGRRDFGGQHPLAGAEQQRQAVYCARPADGDPERVDGRRPGHVDGAGRR